MNRHLLAVSILCFSALASAKQFGTEGATYPIREQSARETIMENLHKLKANGELDKLNQDFKKNALASAKRPKPVDGIEPASEYRTFLVDMTKPNPKDSYDDNGRLFAKKGQLINPLKSRMHPTLGKPFSKHLVIIDGDRPQEVDYALEYAQIHPTKIILVKGEPFELRKKHSTNQIYFDQTGVITRNFDISKTPSVIYQDGVMMRVEEIPL